MNTQDTFCPNIINGQASQAQSGKTFPMENPATGEIFGHAAFSDVQDVDTAVSSAKKAQKSWANVPAKQRGQMLLAIATKLRQHEDELVDILVKETGKAVRTESRPEIQLLPEVFEFFAGLALEIKGETVPFDPAMLTMTVRQPVGVVAAILPWNVPTMLMGFKVGPAILCGNTVVVKSAEQSPLITQRVIELMNEVLPAGVCNLLSGDGPIAGASLVAHKDIAKVTFTGSVEAGRHVYQSAAKRFVPTTLELGGKSAMLVCDDADLDRAVQGAVTGMRFTRQGQSCSASSRIFVHESCYDQFVQKLLDEVNELVIGDPTEEATDIGAVISQEQLEKIQHYSNLAKDTAKVHVCGKLPTDPKLAKGFYHQPTIVTEVTNDAEICQNEIFGPVTCVIKYSDFSTALAEANDTEYGLCASVWTRDVSRALQSAHQLEAGFVQVNQNLVVRPGLSYGGIKSSGLGKEASLESMLEHFTDKKTIIVNMN